MMLMLRDDKFFKLSFKLSFLDAINEDLIDDDEQKGRERERERGRCNNKVYKQIGVIHK